MFREMGALSEDGFEELKAASERFFRAAMEDGRYIAWFGEVDEALVAGGGIQVGEIPPRPGPTGRMLRPGPQGLIVNVYVEPAWRGKGIAKALMDKMIRFSRLSGFSHLVLHASEAGRPIYESLGFEPTAEMRLFL
jgi:GNAT superfamily N-acetyltransferase